MISSALHDTLIATNGFVVKHDVTTDDGDSRFESRYSITKSAISRIFSKAAAGRRAGGDLHLSTIFMNMDVQTNLGNYCIPDLGSGVAKHADLLIFSPKSIKTKDDHSKNDNLYHPSEWSEKVVAVEVETDPTKHWDQVVINWKKNTKLGYFVWFVVFSEHHKNGIYNKLYENGISSADYAVQKIDRDCLIASANAASSDSIRRLSEVEAVVMKILINSGSSNGATQKYICEEAWKYDETEILKALESLQKNSGLVKTTTTNNDPDNGEKESKNVTHVVWSFSKPKNYPLVEKLPEKEKTDTTSDGTDATTVHTEKDHDDKDLSDKNDSVEVTATKDNDDDNNDNDEDIPILSEKALFKMWVDNHDKTDTTIQNDIQKIEAELINRGKIIKDREGKFYLSEIPS